MKESMDEHKGLAAPLSPMTRAQSRSRLHGRRILYVDDELNMRRAVARLLHFTGAVCVSADTHAQVVLLVALDPLLDLVILDFQMPDGDVGDLVRRLRIQRPGLSLVGTSATDRRADFAARGVDHFLLKPWTFEDLLGVTEWSDARVCEHDGPAESTASARTLPGSGDTRALPAQGKL